MLNDLNFSGFYNWLKRRQYYFIFLFFLLCLPFAITGCFLGNTPHLPHGWQIIRRLDGILALALDGDTVWVGCKDGVYAVNRKSGAIINKLKHSPSLTYVRSLLVDKPGSLYIGHFNGLTRYDGANFQTYTQKDGLPDNRVNALLQDHDGRLWIGTWGGAAILDNGKWQKYLTASAGLINTMVNVMFQDTHGGMWFGSYVAPYGGISYFKAGKWQLFSTKNGLPHNNVTSIFEDSAGSVWSGTGLLDRGGAIQFVSEETGVVIRCVLTRRDGLAADKVRSIFQDKDGALWFGSEYDGLARYNKGKWTVFTEKEGLSQNEVTCMVQDRDGNLWIGTLDGLTRVSYSALITMQ
jgi:ligand-binding sensor domain-containing protein